MSALATLSKIQRLTARAHYLVARAYIADLRAVVLRDGDSVCEDVWHYALLIVSYREMARNYRSRAVRYRAEAREQS
jgi:hypothetical protein